MVRRLSAKSSIYQSACSFIPGFTDDWGISIHGMVSCPLAESGTPSNRNRCIGTPGAINFSRRAAVLGGGQLALLGLLAGRMYQLQVLDSDKYRTLAEENRIKLRLLTPLRGRILDPLGER